MQTFLRRLEILNFLTQRKSSRLNAVGTDIIVQHLRDAGYLENSSDKARSQFRLVQRDLKFLLGELIDDEYENDFGLSMARGEGKSLLWALEPYQQLSYDFERMPAYMALAMQVSQKHLSQVLPSSTKEELAKFFDGAEYKLQKAERKLSQQHYRRLTRAVEFYQRGQSLQAPEFDTAVLDRIYEAILRGRKIIISYRSGAHLKNYTLHPYGVAIMMPKLYLIAQKEQEGSNESAIERSVAEANSGFRSFLLHKIERVELSPFANKVPEDFELKMYLESGNMDVLIDTRDTEQYDLVMDLYSDAGQKLLADLNDSPLNSTQTLSEITQGVWRLNAQVRRTIQLRNWLLTLGAQAKVLSPTIIREDLLKHLDQVRAHY
jgi:predicted DNA-binding transcriptional regulator YafY